MSAGKKKAAWGPSPKGEEKANISEDMNSGTLKDENFKGSLSSSLDS